MTPGRHEGHVSGNWLLHKVIGKEVGTEKDFGNENWLAWFLPLRISSLVYGIRFTLITRVSQA